MRRDYNSFRLNKFLHKPRQVWKCFNKIIHNKSYTSSDIKSLNLPNSNTRNDPQIISNAFNDCFCSIGRELSSKLPNTEPTYHSLIPFNSRTMAVFPTIPIEINSVINSIKLNSNLNNILPINYIKECRDIFVERITICINKCFDDGSLPDNLKCAKIIPFFKRMVTHCPWITIGQSPFYSTFQKSSSKLFLNAYLILQKNLVSLIQSNLGFNANRMLQLLFVYSMI